MLRSPVRGLVACAAAAAILAVGGPAAAVTLPADMQISSQAATQLQARSAAFTVSAVSGDTLWGLAAKWCGNPYAYPALAAASGISNPDRIQVGQHITITCTQQPAPAPAPTPQPAGSSAGWVAPLTGTLYCVSGWGAPRPGHIHKGIDLPRRSGTPIRAAHSGTVTIARWGVGAGWYVMVNHGVYQTVYMHMVRRPPVRVGQRVVAGQTVGFVGSTGHSSGPHLHFEVHREAWHPFNPAPFLRAHHIPVKGC